MKKLSCQPPARVRVCTCIVASLLAAVLASPTGAQVEVRAAERTEEMVHLQASFVPLQRHLLLRQRLAFWLPPGWSRIGDDSTSLATFSRDEEALRLQLDRRDTQPGASLFQIMESTVEELRRRGLIQEVESIRQLRIASRNSLEVAASYTHDEETSALRLVLVMDPNQEQYRLVLLWGDDHGGESLDAVLKRLLRDWTPLDTSVWTSALERLRSTWLDDSPSLQWSERNRLFADIALPTASGQPWVGERLATLAQQDPRLLLDGAFHHHPRVRIASLRALEPAALEEPRQALLFSAAMLDVDPAVGFQLSRRLVDSPPLANAVLDRLLSVDSLRARQAAFQLLASAPDILRSEMVWKAFGMRRQYPEESQLFVFATLLRWGERAELEARMKTVWKLSRSERLRKAALIGLLDAGNQDAIAIARQRLDRPQQESRLALSTAALFLAGLADSGTTLELWRLRISSLERLEEEASNDENKIEPRAAREIAEQLVAYLESLPEGASTADECAALDPLRGQDNWAQRRWHLLACVAAKPPSTLIRASIPRPGDYAFSLLALMDRLEVGSASLNLMYRTVIATLRERLDHWAGDPITMTSTGFDLEAPLELISSRITDEDRGSAKQAAVVKASLRLGISDPEQALETLARTMTGKVNLDNATNAVLFANALPLLPAALISLWDDEQETVSGLDSNSSTPIPRDRYFAIGAAERSGRYEQRAILLLEIAESGPVWRQSHLFRQDHKIVLTNLAEFPDEWEQAKDQPSELPDAASRIQFDFAAVLADALAKNPDLDLQELIDANPHLSARTSLEPSSIVTALDFAGFPRDWLSLGRNQAVETLRAPSTLLPRDCFHWTGLSFSPPALERFLQENLRQTASESQTKYFDKLRKFTHHLRGEAGVAILGVPDPRASIQGETAQASWLNHLVVYLSVEPSAADRLLKKMSNRREKRDDHTLYFLDDGVATRWGEFLVAAARPETLAALRKAPFLTSSPLYKKILARAPGEAVLWTGMDTEMLADTLKQSIEGRQDDQASILPVEMFRSLGQIVGWFRGEESSFHGEIASYPHLRPETSALREQRPSEYTGLIRGSVGSKGLPTAATGQAPLKSMELTLNIPADLPDFKLDWSNERLDQTVVDTGTYRFVSRAGDPLPEHSDLTLPITGPELLPYVRNERDLNLHLKEVQTLAESIRGSETDPARIVRAIVTWANESLDYTVIPGTDSVEKILSTRQADCTEFTQMTIALTRSLGIPARPVVGFYVGRKAAYLHQWAEVYLDRWYEVDPTWGVVRIPPTNLRIPADSGTFLASIPGSRFTVESAESMDGGWVRRLPEGDMPDLGRAAGIAVVGQRILIDYPLRSTSPQGSHRLLYSEDGGQSFAEIPPPDSDSTLLGMVGGHSKLLRIQRGDGDEATIALFSLEEPMKWRRVPMPPEIEESQRLALAYHPSGYLALSEKDGPNLDLFSPDLSYEGTIPFPSGPDGNWILSRDDGLLVRSVQGQGITLFAWSGSQWQVVAELDDSKQLIASSVRHVAGVPEVLCHHRESAVAVVIRLTGDSQTRRTALPQEIGPFTNTAPPDETSWATWIDSSNQLLIRRGSP